MKKFDGLAMVVAAAEETGEDLIDGRGDAYCGVLNASYNLKLRNLKAYIPEYPVATRSFGGIGVFAIPEINFNQPKGMLYPTENPF